MLENNISISKVLQDMGCTDGFINAKDAKRYLSKVVGIDSVGTSSDNWIHELGLGKKI